VTMLLVALLQPLLVALLFLIRLGKSSTLHSKPDIQPKFLTESKIMSLS